MRKVKIKKWIPAEKFWDGSKYTIEKGTSKFQDDFLTDGLFHQWATMYEEFTNGIGQHTIALVELEDGTIQEVIPSHIKFIN